MESKHNSQYIFEAKTNDAFYIKILIEILQNNIKNGCFELSEEGIEASITDSRRIHRIFTYFKLYAKQFNVYRYSSAPMSIGLNINHLYKMLKCIKKKDSIILFIEKNRTSDLGITIIPKENNRLTTSYLKIQNLQNLKLPLPVGYSNIPVNIYSTEFSKTIKELANISNIMTIRGKKFQIKFECENSSIYSKEAILGEMNPDDTSDYIFTDDFTAEHLQRITKISGLSSNLQIYFSDGLPLLLKTNIGIIGEFSVYLKSKTQSEVEEKTENSEDYSDDDD